MSASDAEPAQRLATALNWDDVDLDAGTLTQVRELEQAMTASQDQPGFRALFYGPAGSGKTITAILLGRQFERDVFRIDLARVVSKFIGETEQNLARLFEAAEAKDWILFFDEADALFGKRTEVRDSHDRYSDEQIAAILDRIEAYDGLVILTTNRRSSVDDELLRRCQATIKFAKPPVDKP